MSKNITNRTWSARRLSARTLSARTRCAYTGISALIAILMATGCTARTRSALSQYFKGWTITIKPATQSSISTDTVVSNTSIVGDALLQGSASLGGDASPGGEFTVETTSHFEPGTLGSSTLGPGPKLSTAKTPLIADSHRAVNSRRK